MNNIQMPNSLTDMESDKSKRLGGIGRTVKEYSSAIPPNTKIMGGRVMERDPVCGMQVDPARAPARAEHAGRAYFFCCPGCAQKFQLDPDEYLSPRPASPPASLVVLGAPPPPPAMTATSPASSIDGSSISSTAPVATAPPTPRAAPRPLNTPAPCIRRSSSQARVAARSAAWRSSRAPISAEEAPNEELISMTRRFWVSVALTVPVLLLAMGEMLRRIGERLFSARGANRAELDLA